MTALPLYATVNNYNEDSDDIFQARAEFVDLAVKVNQIRDFLAGLFGTDGTKATATAVLGAREFAYGTVIWFCQPAAPVGWVVWALDQHRYLVAMPNAGPGGQPYGNYVHQMHTTPTVLAREHLPAITLTGVTDWQGHHEHTFTRSNATWFSLNMQERIRWQQNEFAPFLYNYEFPENTSGAGNHYHNINVPLGGANWGHNHIVDMSSYRPAAMQGVLAWKAV